MIQEIKVSRLLEVKVAISFNFKMILVLVNLIKNMSFKNCKINSK